MDQYRPLLQGSYLVRFANRLIDKYRQKKDFVLVVYYISSKGKVHRDIMFEKDEHVSWKPLLCGGCANPTQVYYIRDNSDISTSSGRTKFLRELYSMMTWLHEYDVADDVSENIAMMKYKISDKQWSTLYDGTWPAHDGPTESSVIVKELSAVGYWVVPGALENVHGRFEPLSEVRWSTMYRKRTLKPILLESLSHSDCV